MRNKRKISFILSLLFGALAGLNLLIGLRINSIPGDTDRSAKRVESILAERMNRLEGFCADPPHKLPEDMVIYVYRLDTLVEWHNQFMVRNDQLTRQVQMQYLSSPKGPSKQPLDAISEEPEMFNFGNKFYIAKRKVIDDRLVLMGLELMENSSADGQKGTINPNFKLSSAGYSIAPLSTSGGSAVHLDGKPVFKICYDALSSTTTSDFALYWLALFLLIAGSFLAMYSKQDLKHYAITALLILLAIVAMYIGGRLSRDRIPVFSPTLYSGDSFLFSLGAVYLVNLCIISLVGGLVLTRKDLFARIKSRRQMALWLAADILAIVLIVIYSYVSLSSIVLNSNITLELYKFGGLSINSALIYLSYISMLVSVPMLLYLANPALSRLFGFHLQVFSSWGSLLASALTAIFIVVLAATQGFHKEERRASVWANRIAVDRDISLEMDLCRADSLIESDPLIGPLAALGNSASAVRNRITENYLRRLGQGYDIVVNVLDNVNASLTQRNYLNSRTSGGLPIADGSHFLFHESDKGNIRYSGVFYYYVNDVGVVSVLIEIEPKLRTGMLSSNLGLPQRPGSITIPSFYSYARYKGQELRFSSGRYAYPTLLDRDRDAAMMQKELSFHREGYVHFSFPVSEDEVVIFSRPEMGFFGYLIAVIFVTLFSFFYNRITCSKLGKRRAIPGPSYFRTRVIWILEAALVIVLVIMAAVSVQFVLRLNNATMNSVMTDKLTLVQSLVQNQIRNVHNERSLRTPDFVTVLNTVSENTRMDISLYSVDGRALVSTVPELYSRMLLGNRIDETAYHEIILRRKSYFIQKENVGKRSVNFLYAPLVNDNAQIIAILQCPYSGPASYELERDATLHSVTILSVFFIMLLFSRLLAIGLVNRIFLPLNNIGRKMNSTGLDHMEHISYERDDEVRVLVDAYNRMVDKLTDSTKKLAAAERDKAWSSMARQVTHEIRTLLTPMKLSIQRLQRLKAKGAENWPQIFDEVSEQLIEQTDMLSATASDFSAFAKLYEEEPVGINLGSFIEQQIDSYNGINNIKINYLGLDGAFIIGPKPQLTRVIINLINNSIQALEKTEGGKILVSVRNSDEHGFYDILVEDNGPGVSQENLDKLFTPNFTTKSSGTGLGLAISKIVLERAGASISYSKSFTLGGACFKIHYPKASR